MLTHFALEPLLLLLSKLRKNQYNHIHVFNCLPNVKAQTLKHRFEYRSQRLKNFFLICY